MVDIKRCLCYDFGNFATRSSTMTAYSASSHGTITLVLRLMRCC